MLDAVPLAGPGRQVRDGDGRADLIGEALQLALAPLHAGTVAAAAVGTCGTSHTLMPHEGKVGGTKRLTRHWALCGAALVVC